MNVLNEISSTSRIRKAIHSDGLILHIGDLARHGSILMVKVCMVIRVIDLPKWVGASVEAAGTEPVLITPVV